tara:strand:+ start:2449 stop:2622 length:174 start_codon:yes stop_codon:yes gene_type:complete
MTKLNDLNTTDIVDAIRLGCRAMSSVLNADDKHSHSVDFAGNHLEEPSRSSMRAISG